MNWSPTWLYSSHKLYVTMVWVRVRVSNSVTDRDEVLFLLCVWLCVTVQAMKTLEEVHMPQNGINARGISALAEAFAVNKQLSIINLSDNTFTADGARSMAKVSVCCDEQIDAWLAPDTQPGLSWYIEESNNSILHITIPEMHHNNVSALSKHKYLFYATWWVSFMVVVVVIFIEVYGWKIHYCRTVKNNFKKT